MSEAKSFLLIFIAWWVAIGVIGCATSPVFQAVGEKAIQTDDHHVSLASRPFREHRELDDFATARTRWLEGDIPGCLDRLYQVVDREPEHEEARLLLVEALLAKNRVEEARCHQGLVLSARPDHESPQDFSAILVGPIPSTIDPQQPPGETLISDGTTSSEHSKPSVLPVCAELPLETDRENRSESPDPAKSVTPLKQVLNPSRSKTRSSIDRLIDQGRRGFDASDADLGSAYFREAIAFSPTDTRIPIQAALLCVQSNRPDLAIEFLQPAQKISPQQAAIPRIMGVAYYRLGDYRSAEVALERSLSLDKSHALSYFIMGCTKVKLGYPVDASRYYRIARMLDSRTRLD